MDIDQLKENVFEAELKLAQGVLRWELAKIEFQNSRSVKTFNAMDDERLACAGLSHARESAVALLDETLAASEKPET